MTAKEILLKIKAAFDFPAPPPAEPALPPPATPTAKTYKLQDGVTDITINQAGEMPAIGDSVMIGGAPAPANTYILQDGSTIIVDAAGLIQTYTAMAAPPPAPAPAPPPAPAVPITLTAEAVREMYAKFAIGSTEDRLANLEVMMKAVMECNFGYEIRKGQEATAIETYKESLANMQITVDAAKAEMKTAFEKVEAQQVVITKHETTIKDLFELAELLVNAPTVEPVTLTDSQKQKFDRVSAKDQRLKKMAEALKNNKALA
jgi:hypothetical protein